MGCGKLLPYDVQSPLQKDLTKGGNFISGGLQLTDTSAVSLQTDTTKPLVVMFSAQSCSSCRVDAAQLKNALTDPNSNPNQVNVYTIIVGSDLSVAQEWKNTLGLPWNVGSDPNGAIYKSYCNIQIYPCIMIQMPNKGIVYQGYGTMSYNAMKAYTGNWQN